MIKIYHVTGTRGIRAIWTCEELGLEYKVESVDFSPEKRRSPEWLAINPLGKVPVLEDGDLRMSESVAMVQFLLDRYGEGRLQPKAGTDDAARYLEWCWLAEATFTRPLGDLLHHTQVKPEAERVASVAKEGRERASRCLETIERHMESQHDRGQDYLMGNELTGADIAMGWSLGVARRVGLLSTDASPHATKYLDTLEARPAFKVAAAS